MKEEEIKKAVNLKTYNDAIVFLKTQKDIQYSFYVLNNQIHFQVKTMVHEIKGIFDLSLRIEEQLSDFNCTCDEQVCRHKVAALVFLRNQIFALNGNLKHNYVVNPNYNKEMDPDINQKYRNYFFNKLLDNEINENAKIPVIVKQKLYLYKRLNTQEVPSIGYEIGVEENKLRDVSNYTELEIVPKYNWTKSINYGSFKMEYEKMYFPQKSQIVIKLIDELLKFEVDKGFNTNKRFLKLNDQSLYQFLIKNDEIDVALNSKSQIKLFPKVGYDYTIDFSKIEEKVFAKIKMNQAGYWNKLGINGGVNYYIVETQKGHSANIYLPKNEFEKYIASIDKVNNGEEQLIEVPSELVNNLAQIINETLKSNNVIFNYKTENNDDKEKFNAHLLVDANRFGNLNLKLTANYGKEKYYPKNNSNGELDSQPSEKIINEFEEFKTRILKYGREAYTSGEYNVNSPSKIIQVLSGQLEKEKPSFLEIEYTQEAKDHFTVLDKPKINVSMVGELLNVDIDIKGINREDIQAIIQKIEKMSSSNLDYFKLENGKIFQYNQEIKDALTQHAKLTKENLGNIHPLIKLVKAQAIYSSNSQFNYKINDEATKLLKKITTYKSAKVKYKTKIPLREYQIKGVDWMKQLSDLGFSGILADDMGLGKTIQVITFIKNHLVNNEKVIIVMPKALLYNWESEIQKFAPELSYTIIDGGAKERELKTKEYLADSNKQIILTTYSSLQKDHELFNDLEFNHMFIDEAQHIKNPVSKNHYGIKQINAKSIFALTGTPIENNLNEFWSIFDVLLPGLLGNKSSFSKIFVKQNDKQSNEILKKTVAPFILRRLKKDVLTELPDKIETPIILELEPKQEKLYNSLHALARNEVLETLKASNIAQNKIKILSLLTKLRQACCYPQAIDELYKGKNSKIELLNELVEELMGSNHRILLFSQFTTVLKEIEKNFKKLKIKTLYLDGKTKAKDRQELTKEFNEDDSIPIFLISLKAGGTGLNLTGADTVIHFDPWWNPSIENQASDRAYRMGQEKNVQVIKLICKNTIEEKIVELQNRKQNLINDVLDNEEKAISTLSERELLDLFDIKND